MRKTYQKPAIKTEKMFERTVLACGKQQTGPTCAHLGKSNS